MSLEQVMKDLNSKYKSKLVNQGLVFEKVPRLPFSSPRLNYMTYGGLPLGRLVEFSGDEGGGKTTTALDVVKQAQKMFPDKRVLYVDVERTLDAEWCQKLGVDLDSIVVLAPESHSAEKIFSMVKELVETGEISLAVIDSYGVMISSSAYSKTLEDKTYAGISGPLTLFTEWMIPICARTKCILLGINQMREDMNSTYGGTKTTGGRAWRHNCSIRMQFTRSDYVDEKGTSLTRGCENPVGHEVRVALIKSKVCPSNRKIGTFTLNYLTGIDLVSDVIDVAVKEGFITVAGSWYYIVDVETGEVYTGEDGKPIRFQGKSKLHAFLTENTDWLDELNEQILLRFV